MTRDEIVAQIEAIGQEIIALEAAQQQERTEPRKAEIVARKAARQQCFAALEAVPAAAPPA